LSWRGKLGDVTEARDGVDLILEQWRRERPDLDPSPIGVIGRISRLARELELRLEDVYRQQGLEPGWHDVLATLRRSGPPYRLRPSDFSGALMLTSSGTTKRLDRLEQAGLITREPDPADRRGTLIALTDKGRELIDRATDAHLANERRLLGALSAKERDQLADVLRKLQLGLPPR
jgi:DNA-binding MarR family transcriptional regulator